MPLSITTRTSCLVLGVLCIFVSGCVAQMPVPREPRPQVETPTQLPAYDDIVAGYNQRIDGLPRLWARTVGRIWYSDEDGQSRTEQVEGHLNYVAVDRLLLTFDKVNQTYGLMGSDEERYWWIELDRERRAHVGEHARVTPRHIAELGMPIYPRDVIDLLGITPLPVEAVRTSVAWNDDHTALIVTTPARSMSTDQSPENMQRLWIHPETFEPLRIEMLDSAGEVRIVSELSRYQQIAVPGGGPEVPRPYVPGQIVVTTPHDDTQMRLRISSPEVSSRRPRDIAFDLDALIRRYNVREVISLDEPRARAQ